MDALSIDYSRPLGKIKPMHGINNAPLVGWNCDKMFHYLTEAGIPISRLHDTGGICGGGVFVDIANVFPRFEADPFEPASYHFMFTDMLLCALVDAGVRPFYRLGCTIENFVRAIGPYRVFPPVDVEKWAVICEHIIRHYNEGWADGYHLHIEYWEIWNEPDNEPDINANPMWRGTKEEYYHLYEVASNHLKTCFPQIKIGGYASCGFYEILSKKAKAQANVSTRTEYFIEFFEGFLKHITSEGHRAPLDFFSWHSYSGAEENAAYAAYVRQMLNEYGFTETESILNEWNPGVHRRGKPEDAAYIGAMFVTMQNSSVDSMAYYDGQLNFTYAGLFNPITFTPFKAYYAFKAFNELYKLGVQYAVENTDEYGMIAPGVYVLAAGDAAGMQRAVVLYNIGEEIKISAPHGIWSLSVLDERHDLGKIGQAAGGECITIPASGALLLTSVGT